MAVTGAGAAGASATAGFPLPFVPDHADRQEGEERHQRGNDEDRRAVLGQDM